MCIQLTLIIGCCSCSICIFGISLHIHLVGYHHPQHCQSKKSKDMNTSPVITNELSRRILKFCRSQNHHIDKLEKAWELR